MNLDTFGRNSTFSAEPAPSPLPDPTGRARPGSPAIGALRVARASSPRDASASPDRRVAYFADSQDTAGYEVFGRREQQFISLERLRAGELLCAELADDMILLDLTQHAASYPVLQSTRYSRRRRWLPPPAQASMGLPTGRHSSTAALLLCHVRTHICSCIAPLAAAPGPT